MKLKTYLISALFVLFCTASSFADLGITRLNRTSGGTTGFTHVAIWGSGFTKTAQVYFGDQRVILDRFIRSDLIYVLTTSYPTEETVDIKIVQGDSEVVLENGFTFEDKAPALSSINKTQGLTEGGLRVLVKGDQLTPKFTASFGDKKTNRFIFAHDRRVYLYTPSNEGVVDFTYENEFGSSTLEDGFEFLSDSDERSNPVISSISRSTMLPEGGARVLIRGNHFSAFGQWQLGGVPATTVRHLNTNRVYIHTPALPENSTYNLSYIGDNGTVDYVDALESVSEAPVLKNLIPNKGFVDTETIISLRGLYFTDNIQVFIGDKEATFYKFNHDGRTQFKTQPQSAGVYDLKIVSAHGELVLPKAFEHADKLPRIDYLWPSIGSINGGTSVLVRGNHFEVGQLTAELGGVMQNLYQHRNTRHFRFKTQAVPQTASVDLRVITPEGEFTRENAFLYDRLKPVIRLTRPITGPTRGRRVLDIFGSNFTSDTIVTLGDQVYPIHRFYNSGLIRIKTQKSDAGQVDIQVENDEGSDKLEDAYTFVEDQNVNSGEPTISWISNAKGAVTGRTPVYIRGKNFTEDLVVTLNGERLDFWRHPRAHLIRFFTPRVDAATSQTLVLSNSYGDSTFKNAIKFVEEEPQFLSIRENDGYVHGDTFFTIYGKHLTPHTEVFIEGKLQKTHRFHHAHAVTFQSTGGTLGTKDIEIRTENGSIFLEDAWNYKALPPFIKKVRPNIAEAQGGTWVRVFGKYFSPDTEIQFNGMDVLETRVHNTRHIQVKIPDNSDNVFGLVDVEANNQYGQNTLTKGFYYKENPNKNLPPSITSAAITSATEDIVYTYDVQVTDADDANDGVNLTWSLQNAPLGMTISTTGQITWSPAEEVLTSGEVTVVVADGGENGAQPATQSFTITVTPVNDAPSIAAITPPSAIEDLPVSFQVIASDSDNDLNSLNWSLNNAPTGMTISNSGLVEWTATEGVLTSGEVTVSVSDGTNSSSQTFTITVTAVNDSPVITTTELPQAGWGVDYGFQLEFTDPDDLNDGTELTWGIETDLLNLSISTTGTVYWTGSGNIPSTGSFKVTLADGGENNSTIAEATFIINKVEDTTAPALNITNPDANDLVFTTSAPTFIGTFSDDNGIDASSFELTLSDVFIPVENISSDGFNVTVPNVEDGTHILVVKVSDYAGNESTDSRILHVDLSTTPPGTGSGNNSNFTATTVISGVNPQHLRLVDANEDGKLDIVYKEINDGQIKVIYQQ